MKKAKLRLITTLFIITFVMISASFTGVAHTQNGDYKDNLNSYIRSETPQMVMKIYVNNMRNVMSRPEEKLDLMFGRHPEHRSVLYLRHMRNYGINLVRMIDEIYVTMNEIPVSDSFEVSEDFNFHNTTTIVLTGKFPLSTLRGYLKPNGFDETSMGGVKKFFKQGEEFVISIIDEKIMLVTPLDKVKNMVDTLQGKVYHRKGIMCDYVNKAERNYNLMYSITDLRDVGSISIIDIKESMGRIISDFRKLPDELDLISVVNGLSVDRKRNLSNCLSVETVNHKESELLCNALNKAFTIAKITIPPLISRMSVEEENAHKFITYISHEEFYDAYDMLGYSLIDEMEPEDFEEEWQKNIISLYGHIQSIVDHSYNTSSYDSKNVVFTCRTEKGNYFDVGITLDVDNMVKSYKIKVHEGRYKEKGLNFDNLPSVTKTEHRAITDFLYSLNANQSGRTAIISMKITKELPYILLTLMSRYAKHEY